MVRILHALFMHGGGVGFGAEHTVIDHETFGGWAT